MAIVGGFQSEWASLMESLDYWNFTNEWV